MKSLRNSDNSINHIAKAQWLSFFHPRIVFNKVWNMPYSDIEEPENKGAEKIFDADLELSIGHYTSELQEPLKEDPDKDEILSICAEDFTNLLKLAMEKAASVGLVTDDDDLFHISHSSISEHSQNDHLRSWTHLVDMVRDSFDATMRKNSRMAHTILLRWQNYSYPLFYRLSLYAVTKHSALDENIILQLLGDRKKRALWASPTQVEILRYLKKRTHTAEAISQLTQLILEGYPRDMFKESLSDEKFSHFKDRGIHIRLERLSQSGATLPNEAQEILKKLRNLYGAESINEEWSDFPTWHESGFVEDTCSFKTKSVEEIRIELLKAPKPMEDDWSPGSAVNSEFRSLATMQPEKTIHVLDSLSQDDHKECPWILRAALNGIIWIGDQNKPSRERRRFLCQAVKHLISDDDLIIECRIPLANGMQKDASALSKIAPDQYFDVWRKILNFVRNDLPEEPSSMRIDPLNTISGKLGWMLMDIFRNRYPGTVPPNGKIPKDLLPFFNDLIRSESESVLPALYHLGMHAFLLYYIDPRWVRDNLLPSMNWGKPKSAHAIWSGYLINRQSNREFFLEIKPMFLASLEHYAKGNEDNGTKEDEIVAGADDNSRNLANILFDVCFDAPEGLFDQTEMKRAIASLDVQQLQQGAWRMSQTLDRAGDKAGALWKKRISSWFTEYWPKTARHQTDEISIRLVEVVLACREQFPEALKVMEFMYPMKKRVFPLYFLEENEGGKYDPVFAHPSDLLELLGNIVTEEKCDRYRKFLPGILDRILKQDETLERNSIYQRLRGYT